MFQCHRDKHVKIPADWIRQQPEYKAILSKRSQTPSTNKKPGSVPEAVRPPLLKSAFLPDTLRARRAYIQSTSLGQQQQLFENPGVRDEDTSELASGCLNVTRSPSTNHKSSVMPYPLDPTNVVAHDKKVIIREDNDMGLSGTKQKCPHFSRHNVQPLPSQKTKKSAPSVPRPEFRSTLVCHMMATRKLRRSNSVHVVESPNPTGVTRPDLTNEMVDLNEYESVGKPSSTSFENETVVEDESLIKCVVEHDPVDEKDPSNAKDRSETGTIKDIIDLKTDKSDEAENSAETFQDTMKDLDQQSISNATFPTDTEITMTNKVHCAMVQHEPDIILNEPHRVDSQGTITSPTSLDTPQQKQTKEHRANVIQFSEDTEHFHQKSPSPHHPFQPQLHHHHHHHHHHHNSHQPHPVRTQSTGSMKPRPQSACVCEPTASGYDHILEKSAVYLRSRSQTFTRASQYMGGGNRRGLSLLNVHYSQTNTGYNDRIIFADLLKSAHISNAVIGDSVYTMERRLYNRRQDPARCTTFYDRFQKSSRNNSKSRRQRSKSVSDITTVNDSTEDTVSPTATRTVADKQKARKERIRQKKVRIEIGYTPTMARLKVPTSRDMDDMLLSCRYLRVQPCKQPWLYDNGENQGSATNGEIR